MKHLTGMRLLTLCVMLSTLVGCTTYRYIPDGNPPAAAATNDLALYQPEVESYLLHARIASSLHSATGINSLASGVKAQSQREVAQWFPPGGNVPLKVQVVGLRETDLNTSEASAWLSVLTLFAAPVVDNAEHDSVVLMKLGDEVIYKHTETYQLKGYKSLFPLNFLMGRPASSEFRKLTSDQLARHRAALARHIESERGDYEVATSGADSAALQRYLADNPGSMFRLDALRRLALMAPTRNPLAFHIKNVEMDRNYLRFIPSDQAIWFVGPDELRVHQVLTESRRQDEALLATRIRTSGGSYKVFDQGEIARLQNSGIKPSLIAAMMDVSNSAAAPSSSSLGGAIGAGGTAGGSGNTAMPASTNAASAESPDAADVAAQCAKRYAAMKTCEQMPFPAGSLCKAAANKQYSHLVCSMIQ